MAPTFRPGRATAVLVGSQDMTGVLKDSTYDATAGTDDVTTYGNDDVVLLPTQRDAQMSLTGLADVNSTGVASINDAVAALAGSTAVTPVTWYGDGGQTIGRAVRLMSGIVTGANVGSPAVGAVTAQTNLKGTGGPRMGWSLRVLGARTSTGSGTGYDTSTNAQIVARRAGGATAHLHITSVTSTTALSAVVKVQHSSNGSAWSDLITFTAAAAVGSERKTTTTAVKQHVRETLSTLTGSTNKSITYAVAVGSPA
jgi:hypothetical protein